MRNIFSNVTQECKETELAELGCMKFKFPTFFFRSMCAVAIFACPIARLKQLTLLHEMKPVMLLPGFGLLTLSFYQHKEVDEMLPYDEVVISIPTVHQSEFLPPLLPLLRENFFPALRHLVLDMPVNSKVNRLRGMVLWNLPKRDSTIWIEQDDSQTRLEVRDDSLQLRLCVENKGTLRHMQNTSNVLGTLMGQRRTFKIITQGSYLRANTLLPGQSKSRANIEWNARHDHPLSLLQPSELRLIETRISKNYQSILYLPEQDGSL